MAKKISYIVLSIVVIGILLYSFQPSDQFKLPEHYLELVQQHRKNQNNFFRTNKSSPLSINAKKAFQGLKYFDIDPSFRGICRLEHTPNAAIMRLNTSSGKIKEYKPYATLHFKLSGKELQLLALQPLTHPDMLFVPFTDQTTGFDTYGAGRYLELPMPDGDQMVLDFNYAFNPYCAFSDGYSCPQPPQENFLNLKITAGEKSPKKH